MLQESIAALIVAQHAIQRQIDALRTLEKENADNRTLRAVSVKAKNIMPGDDIEWPADRLGRQTVNTVTEQVGLIFILSNRGFFIPLDPDHRVRVYRD